MTTLNASTYQCLLDTKDDERDPMNGEIMKMFLGLMTAEAYGGLKPEVVESLRDKNFMLQIMENRLDIVGMRGDVTPECLIFLSMLSCGVPGDAVMWAYTCVKIVEDRGRCDMHILSERFPFGFPTQKALKTVWDKQKQKGAPLGNWLDKMEWTVKPDAV